MVHAGAAEHPIARQRHAAGPRWNQLRDDGRWNHLRAGRCHSGCGLVGSGRCGGRCRGAGGGDANPDAPCGRATAGGELVVALPVRGGGVRAAVAPPLGGGEAEVVAGRFAAVVGGLAVVVVGGLAVVVVGGLAVVVVVGLVVVVVGSLAVLVVGGLAAVVAAPPAVVAGPPAGVAGGVVTRAAGSYRPGPAPGCCQARSSAAAPSPATCG